MTDPLTQPGMVERVAEAIGNATYPEYSIRLTRLIDDVATYQLVMEGLDGPREFESHADASEFVQGHIRIARARAAIEAMRQLDERQIAAAWDAIAPAKKAAGIARLGPGPGVREVWNACIDAALSEQRGA